jgi:tRNA pseudouridine55 synthase
MSRTDCNLLDGILLVNKPQGLSSNAVLQKTKRLLKAKKAGHTGSLDPLATGMLPVCFGEATKISQYLLDADKSYQATGLLGIKTSTADAEGEIISTVDNFSISEKELLSVINTFIGPIHQIPSMFSALKHQGKPLYKLAREGITIERKAREIVIHNIELQEFDGRYFVIKVSCSKGTYIRNLIEDIGERLGVYAHVTQLHRICTAGFDTEMMYTLDELESKTPEALLDCLLPLERAIDYIPIVKLAEDDVLSLKQGKQVQNTDYPSLSGCVRMHDEHSNFIGLGELDSTGLLKVKRLLALES